MGLRSPVRLYSNHEVRYMAEATQAYLSKGSPAMLTRRLLFAAPLVLILPEPVPPPMPPTCMPDPVRGHKAGLSFDGSASAPLRN
jgi:hypothetical protein